MENKITFREATHYPDLNTSQKLDNILKKTGIDAMRLFKSGKCTISTDSGDKTFTLLDLFALPAEVRNNIEQIIPLIQEHANLSENANEQLEAINRSFLAAISFHREYLLMEGFPKEIDRLIKNGGFKRLNDFYTFLKKTTHAKGKPGGFAPIYCAIASCMLAESQRVKSQLQNLESECEQVRENLFEPNTEGKHQFFCEQTIDEHWDQVLIVHKDDRFIRANMSHRGKSDQRVLAKMLMKPEWTAKEAIKDAVGFKFEVKSADQAADLLIFLKEYLSQNFSFELEEIEETHFITDNEAKEKIQKRLGDSKVDQIKTNDNPNVHKDFQAIKLTGRLSSKKEERIVYDKKDFPLEVQIVLVGNQNEAKMSRHEVYEAVQKLSVFTRLYGSFSEGYLNKICEAASMRTAKGEGCGISIESIKEYILTESLYQINDKSRGKRFASRSHFDRWKAVNYLPKDMNYSPPAIARSQS